MSYLLELELMLFVWHSTWMLGTKLGYPGKAGYALNCRANLPAPGVYLSIENVRSFSSKWRHRDPGSFDLEILPFLMLGAHMDMLIGI